jgi:hypothetical protein
MTLKGTLPGLNPLIRTFWALLQSLGDFVFDALSRNTNSHTTLKT